MEALGGLVLSVLLVVVHDCVGVYVYLKKLPPPLRFLWRLGVLVLLVVVVVGLRVFDGESWVGGGRSLLRYSRTVGLITSLVL